MFMALYAAVLFFVLTPGVLLSLPPGGSRTTVALTHAVVFALVWSMNRHLKRLPETFDAAPAGQEASGADDPPADVPDREGEGPRHEPSG
jgi:hypothetical protein